MPTCVHFNVVIFNPSGSIIHPSFTSNNNYYFDGLKNNGLVTILKEGEKLEDIGYPYIAIYKNINI